MNKAHARELLRKFDFKALFLNELGWDDHNGLLTLTMGEGKASVTIEAVAEKRGMAAFICALPAGGRSFDYQTRCRIEAQLAKCIREHLIIYVDPARHVQTWQWVKREPGNPVARREHTYTGDQSGEALLQKLEVLEVRIEQEDELTLVGITDRARQAFDVDRVTKRFYDQFKTEHAAFLKLIEGIADEHECEWYASIMLNRLKFVYFIQKKGFLDRDKDYLRNRLAMVRKTCPKTKFLSFYRAFLLKLFHDGLGRKERSPELRELLGTIPYLNGGIFAIHPLEEKYADIDIPDKAFEKVFDFFDKYRWHLDERPLRADDEINPDVLGYIFEKYINQKQMGAYYTKEDITEYIAKNCIVPFIFDRVETDLKKKGREVDFRALFQHLAADPDRYIYDPVKHGVALPLPPEIENGVDTSKPNLLERRAGWNKPAPSEYALPTEIWREVVARRQRCTELRTRLTGTPQPLNPEPRTPNTPLSTNDLITLNLNIRQFAQDCIENAVTPDVLWAFWRAIEEITILDPTCGSGAFLFAALNVLEPLYEACLDRMKAFMLEWSQAPKVPHPNFYKDFAAVIARVDKHANEKYFIFKSIIIRNLYGVDIMDEAVEICKLRLFLKLAAQIEPNYDEDNLGIEPLPDIDFNIRAGNTLVGYANADEVRKCMTEFGSGQMRLGVDDELQSCARFTDKLQIADAAFRSFRQQQTELGGTVTAQDKAELRTKLKALEDELNRHLAGEYGVKVSNKAAFDKWVKSHQPFHWFIQFYGIINGGGFDVIIGNPPYLEIRQVDYALNNYACLDSGAIHAMCMERSEGLLHKNGCMSMIVPLSLPSTQRMQIVQKLLEDGRNAWFANYAWRPAKLFDTVNRALTIFVVSPSGDGHTYSTNYQKWASDDREGLMERLNYVEVIRKRPACWIPKVGDSLEQQILAKCLAAKTAVKHFTGKSEHRVYYRTTGGLYWKVFTDFAPAFNLNEKKGHSSRETWFTLGKKEHVRSAIAALSSDVFWWWYTVTSNVRDMNPYDIQNFPIPESALTDPVMQTLGARYLKDLDKNSTMLVREQKQTGTTETQSFKIQKSKPIIDEIDTVLAGHYGFTAEELDFIQNYDIKYRLGRAGGEEEAAE